MRERIKLILESIKKVKSFEKKYGVELPEEITKSQLEVIEKAFSYLPTKIIKGHIKKITIKDITPVRGRYIRKNKKSGEIILNPKIFNYKIYFNVDGKKIPRKIFTIVHEIGHMMDHLHGITSKKKWKDLSGWKELDLDKKVPKTHERYVEKQIGRFVDREGHKKSNWIHKKDIEFARRYSSRNPSEDFADLFTFIVFGKKFDFEKEGQEKIKIIKDLLN